MTVSTHDFCVHAHACRSSNVLNHTPHRCACRDVSSGVAQPQQHRTGRRCGQTRMSCSPPHTHARALVRLRSDASSPRPCPRRPLGRGGDTTNPMARALADLAGQAKVARAHGAHRVAPRPNPRRQILVLAGPPRALAAAARRERHVVASVAAWLCWSMPRAGAGLGALAARHVSCASLWRCNMPALAPRLRWPRRATSVCQRAMAAATATWIGWAPRRQWH